MLIQWFPAHMAQTLKMIDKELKLCDAIIYVLDARCPKSCINPKFNDFVNRKPVLYVYKKQDLACKKYKKQNVILELQNLLKNKIERKMARGVKPILRVIVVGVPNVGKSTLINELSHQKKTKVGNKAGITRTKQWVQINDYLWLLDTPGTLWPEKVDKNLAYVGCVKDEVINVIELSKNLIEDLKFQWTFEEYKKKRGFKDDRTTATAIIKNFRAGKFGTFILENEN
ncbi:MAG: 50S ribosome-binding GTPase [Christensenellaceae bacterium]|jgi:ribosome biogenesis GTPase A|nr:50S ribosome-binding GTPase [Christensenellaceae bacterium]